MGYFSFTCAKTGLPIVSHGQGADPKHSTVYVIPKVGRAARGSYDGYGHILDSDAEEPLDIGGPDGDKMVLAHFFKGESWSELGESKSDPDQGSYDDIFYPALFAAVERFPGFDGHQFLKRHHELSRMQTGARDYIAEKTGFTYSRIWNLRSALERAEYADPEDRDAEVAAAWKAATSDFPDGALPQDSMLQGMSPQEALATLEALGERLYMALVTELVSAWGEGRPTRVPLYANLLSGDGVKWKDAEMPHLSRPRMKF